MAPFNMKAAALLVLVACMAAVVLKVEARPPTCQDVTKSMSNCVPYLRGEAPKPNSICCGGVKNVKGMATTTADRQAICACLKQMATSVKGIKPDSATRLPGQCGVTVNYPLNPNVDCSRIR